MAVSLLNIVVNKLSNSVINDSLLIPGIPQIPEKSNKKSLNSGIFILIDIRNPISRGHLQKKFKFCNILYVRMD